jgi:hypothetical protein
MTATANDIAVVRLGLEIPEGKEAAFTDALIGGFIEAHPVKDTARRKPADAGWTATYDLNAATADLWMLIAASLSSLYDFSADGASFTRAQAFDHANRMRRLFASRAYATSVPLTRDRQTDILYQGNWPFLEELDLQAYEEAEHAAYPDNTTQGTAL